MSIANDGDPDGYRILVQNRRDQRAAKRLPRKLLKRQGRPPRVMITDKLASYSAAKPRGDAGCRTLPAQGSQQLSREFAPAIRRRERQMKRFKSPEQVQRFLSAHNPINNLFHLRRDHVTAAQYRAAQAHAFATWAEVTGAKAAA